MMKYDEASEVQLHLTKAGRRAAGEALHLQGKIGFIAAFRYTGPHFKETDDTSIEVAIGHSTINVVVKDKNDAANDVEYVYPLVTVARVKITA